VLDLLHRLYDVQGLIQIGGLTALAIIIFAETGLFFGFFLPGDSLLVTAGLFAAKGDLNIVHLCVLLSACAILGDAVGFWFGHWSGPRLYRRKDSFFFRQAHLEQARAFYDEHGGKTIVLARFIPIIRTFAPIVAGIAGMRYRSFFAWNVLGGILWASGLTLGGYFLGQAIPDLDKYIQLVIVAVIVLSFVPVLLHLRRR
jgi:membrane-associated protein